MQIELAIKRPTQFEKLNSWLYTLILSSIFQYAYLGLR